MATVPTTYTPADIPGQVTPPSYNVTNDLLLAIANIIGGTGTPGVTDFNVIPILWTITTSNPAATYSVGDIIQQAAAPFYFQLGQGGSVTYANASLRITSVKIWTQKASLTTGIRFHLYKGAYTANQTDGAAFVESAIDASNQLFEIQLDNLSNRGSGGTIISYSQNTLDWQDGRAFTTDDHLFPVLEITANPDAAPTAGQVWYVLMVFLATPTPQ